MTLMSCRANKRVVATATISLAVAVSALATSSHAAATFGVVASGGVPSLAQSVPQAAAPLAAATGSVATVSWSATSLSGGTPAEIYSVRRYDLAGMLLATLTDCATGGALSCTEMGVPTGSYRYTVQAGIQGWHGIESAASAEVVVSPQTLAITSDPIITTLPSVVTGTLGNFVVGETVTYRLDDTDGPVLTGSPTTITDSVSQSVSVTVPEGTTDTVHSIVVVGSLGSLASAAVRVVMPPTLQSLQMNDSNGNGRVDQVLATFSETLATYSAGTAPWTLSNTPSGGSLASVTTSGAVATLTIAEGDGAANTAVGAFTIALAENSSGIRDLNDNLASFTATAPTDGAAPVVTALVMLDNNANGKVDRVTATFSETLAAYSAGTTPWSTADVPSGGVLSNVSVSATVATLTFTEGAGAVDTAVGTMTVGLAGNATGIRDAAGNLSTFSNLAPTDSAAPIPTAVTDTNGATNGRFEPGDTISITFSEGLQLSTVPTSTTVTVTDPSGTGNDRLTIADISAVNRNLGANGYETLNNTSAVFGASTVALSNSNRTVTVGPTCTGIGCAGLGTQGSAANYSFLAATTLTDIAGNTSTKTLVVSIRMC
ncbi:MAG: hypothetical protein HY826_09075 [Actinobacteria bacterium]|nr:hypothetical protein [Actinomycetota bacterium]